MAAAPRTSSRTETYDHTRRFTRSSANKPTAAPMGSTGGVMTVATNSPSASPEPALPHKPTSTHGPEPSSRYGRYTVILEPTLQMDLTIPLQVPVSYESHWPQLLLTDHRDPYVAEEAYIYQGNVLAWAAIRHLIAAVQKFEESVRSTLCLRPGAKFTLSLPDQNGIPVTPMEVIKSLVKQLTVEDQEWSGGSKRASILGSGIARMRVHYDGGDVMRTFMYVARVSIYLRSAAAAEPEIAHIPVELNIDATTVAQMVGSMVDTFFSSSSSSSKLGAATAGKKGDRNEVISLFWNGLELPYGMLLGPKVFRVVEGRMCVDLEARWGGKAQPK